MKNSALFVAVLIATTTLGISTKSQTSSTREQLQERIRSNTRQEDSKWRSYGTYGNGCQVNWESWKKGKAHGVRYAELRNTPRDLLVPDGSIIRIASSSCFGNVTVNCKTLKISVDRDDVFGNPAFSRPRPGDWKETLLLDICSTLPDSERGN